MKQVRTLDISVGGKTIKATVTLDAPGLETSDWVDAQMLFAAAAQGLRVQYMSRHHPDRIATIDVGRKSEVTNSQETTLRLVA